MLDARGAEFWVLAPLGFWIVAGKRVLLQTQG
jgi:hypothetical protein